MKQSAHLITTERCELRPLRPEDAGEIHGLLLEELVRRYLLDGERVSRDWVDAVIADSNAAFAAHGLGLWAARERGAAAILGFTGYRDFYEPPVLELLYALAPGYWGRGLATEIAHAAVDAGFARGLDHIRASTDAPNTASVRVMERPGMRFAGRTAGKRWEQLHYGLPRDALEPDRH